MPAKKKNGDIEAAVEELTKKQKRQKNSSKPAQKKGTRRKNNQIPEVTEATGQKKSSADKKRRNDAPAANNAPSHGSAKKKAEPKRQQKKPKALPADSTITRGKTQKVTKLKGGKNGSGAKLRIIPLGGIGEIGKNITAVEYGDDIIIIDCGVGFPDEDMFGIDLVIPDITYLEKHRDKIRGMVLTHGHEDHIGSIPYVLRSINPPIYGTRLTLKIIENKLKEHRLPWDTDLHCVEADDTVRLGCFSIEFIRVNHSIADACCLAIRTPLGVLIHTGDFKLDLTPIEGDIMNIPRLGELGNQGVLLLMCESTNAERPGYTPSERTVGRSLEYVFNTNQEKRIVISTFSSNVHRVQQILDIAARHYRKVAITGRSMITIISSAVELGYINLPEGVLIDINDIKRYRPEELVLVCTGSQGEPMSALYRMAFGDHSQVTLDRNDIVVISASAIPGNEKLVGRIINELCQRGVGVVNDPSIGGIHVSGHACQEELKLMMALTKPLYFMPVHGEARHLEANRRNALQMGIPDGNIFVSRLGKVLEIDRKGARFAETVPCGQVFVDGSGVGDVGDIVLRDRRILAEDGLVVVVASADLDHRMLLSKPDVISRGFVYMREAEDFMDEVREIAADSMSNYLAHHRGHVDRMQLKNRIKDDVAKFIYQKTKRKPMVLPVIMDL
ncbi:MAG: RNase J family beta-CASP ribonuclease [Clostridia bacterium]|nr:RNase J family beta-CASP ribonuclease [Clostridia bacterium]